MGQDGGVFEPRRPWWRSRLTAAVLAACAGPTLLLLSGAPGAVPLVYATLFVEGDVVAYLALQKAHFTSSERIVSGGSGPKTVDGMFLSKERFEELSSCLKRAEAGSEDSRRQVARDIAPLVAHSGGASAASGGRLSRALEMVVYPYLDDRALRTEMGEAYAEEARKRAVAPKAGRAEYVAGLETILSELEREDPL